MISGDGPPGIVAVMAHPATNDVTTGEAPVASKTYTKSYGDMVLVAELRDGAGGPLLLGSWDHRPAREKILRRL